MNIHRSLWPGLALLLGASAHAEDWPQWLGPNRDGHSAETGVAAGWGPKGPRLLWKADVGEGFSSVSISGGIVYTMGAHEDGEYVIALDVDTGTERWRIRVEDRIYRESMGGNGSRSTPSVSNGQVVSLSPNGVLTVLNAESGAVAWAVDLQTRHDGEPPKWGYSGSPLVHDGKVYVDVGGSDERALMAFSMTDGSPVWHTGAFRAGYSSPIRMETNEAGVILFFTGDALAAVTETDGMLLWSFPWKTSYHVNAATPLPVGDGRVFIGSAYGTGNAVLDLENLTEHLPTVVWKNKTMKAKMATPILHAGFLYGFNESRLTAVDVATGDSRWNQPGYGRGTLIFVDDHLVVLGESCNLALVRADPTQFVQVGQDVQVHAGEPCWTAPAIANGALYLRGPDGLVALDTRIVAPSPDLVLPETLP